MHFIIIFQGGRRPLELRVFDIEQLNHMRELFDEYLKEVSDIFFHFVGHPFFFVFFLYVYVIPKVLSLFTF